MKTITTYAQITKSGLLRLEVPCDLPPGQVEVALVVQPIDTEPTVEISPPYRSLHGIWAGKLPDIDLDTELQEMNQIWKKSLKALMQLIANII